MTPLPPTASDADLIAFIDQWAALLEREAYDEAFAFTDQEPGNGWSPDLMREFIEGYGEALPGQHVTLEGKPTDISQRKSVAHVSNGAANLHSEIWYDLNVDGFASDVTATFWVVAVPDGLVLRLDDIHVM